MAGCGGNVDGDGGDVGAEELRDSSGVVYRRWEGCIKGLGWVEWGKYRIGLCRGLQ